MKTLHRCALLLVSVFFLTQVTSAQIYLLRSKKAVIKQFQRYSKTASFKSTVSFTDTTVTLHVKDTSMSELIFTCYFNARNKCYQQTQTADCDSCFRKYLQQVLNTKRFDWKLRNEKCYISKPFWSTTLFINSSSNYSFSLVHDYFSNALHQQYYKEAK